MKPNRGNQHSTGAAPAGPYWEDPVYHYLSRRHRSAMDAGNSSEAARLDVLMQDLVNRSISEELYCQLDTEARAERKIRKQERKKRQGPHLGHRSAAVRSPSVNVSNLKKRIFNPNVSRENVIKALEGLPSADRKATIAVLPPGLRRKLGQYLKGERL